MNIAVTPIPTAPGLYPGITEDAYHGGPGISKSGLWTIHQSTPAHYKFAEREESKAFDFGAASHFAILQPNRFEKIVHRGPEDRRGNKWKDAEAFSEAEGKLLLTAGDFDKCLRLREALHADHWVNAIITGGESIAEASAYWTRDGLLCKCRPDLYRRDISFVLDLKSTQSAHSDDFAKSVINYGYHAQEAWYTDGLNTVFGAERSADKIIPADDENPQIEIKGTAAGGVQAFAFLAFEKTAPFAHRVYELPPSIVAEGRAIADAAFATYAECARTDAWPAYGGGVEELAFPRWAYKLTPAPAGGEEE